MPKPGPDISGIAEVVSGSNWHQIILVLKHKVRSIVYDKYHF